MAKPIVYSKEKPDVIAMLNAHIEKVVDPIRAMSFEKLEGHVECLRWEFEYSIKMLDRKKVNAFKVAPLETGDSVLEKIQKRTPKRKKQGRKKRSPRETLKALGIYSDDQITAMGIK